jgi:hypothetical protein
MTDRLAAYRGEPKSNVPQPVEDGAGAPQAAVHEGEDAARKAATAPTPAVPLETGDRTPQFVDRQRKALADRFKRERVEERKAGLPASHVPFIDGDDPAIPGALPDTRTEEEKRLDEGEPLDPDEAAAVREKVAAEEAAREAEKERFRATPTPDPKPYTLKVDGNQFWVSREELLRYAEIAPEEAAEFSEPALVRVAQKQIAASNRLAEANAFKDQARKEAPAAATQQEQPKQPQPPPRSVDPALISAIEKIQLGDPKEAAEALQGVFDAGVSHALRDNDQARAVGSVQAEYGRAVSDFTQRHPDVLNDPVLSSTHIAFIAREIADDVKNLGLVDENQYAAIATNPRLAADVLTAARAEGRQVRAPATIFEAAFDKLAAITGQARQTPAVPQAPVALQPRAADSRLEAKRALMPQAARSGIAQIGTGEQPAPPEDRIAVHSAAIQKMRKARFQPTS